MSKFVCPNCGKEYDIDLKLAGKKGQCKSCGEKFIIEFDKKNSNDIDKNDKKLNKKDKIKSNTSFLFRLKNFFIKFFKSFIVILIFLIVVLLSSVYISSLIGYKEKDFDISADFFDTKFGDKDPYSEANGFDDLVEFINRIEGKSGYADILSKCMFDDILVCENFKEKYIGDLASKEIKKFIINQDDSINNQTLDNDIRGIRSIFESYKTKNNINQVSSADFDKIDFYKVDKNLLELYFQGLEYFNKNKDIILEKELNKFKVFVKINENIYEKINDKEYILTPPEYSMGYMGEDVKNLIYTPLIEYSRSIRYVAYSYFEDGEYDKGVNTLLKYQQFIDNLINKTDGESISTLINFTIYKINLESINYFMTNYDLKTPQKQKILTSLENKIDDSLLENSIKRSHINNKKYFEYSYNEILDRENSNYNSNIFYYYYGVIFIKLFYSLEETELISDVITYNLIKNKGHIKDFDCGFSINNFIGRRLACNTSLDYTSQYKKEENLRKLRSDILEKLK